MQPKKWLLLLINIIGGAAVLGSYALTILTHPNAGQILWGEVPESIRPYYTTNMLLATMGYFAFIYFILFKLDPVKTRVAGRFGYGLFTALFTVILLPSALWMPLTFLAFELSSQPLLWAVRVVLWIVGLASVALCYAIMRVEPHQSLWAKRVALVGSIAFCIQTAFLDAIVWVFFFRI